MKAALSAPGRLADVVVDVAVADMAERQRPRARDAAVTAAFASLDEGRHGRDRHRHVVLDRAAFVLLHLADMLRACARTPCACSSAAAIARIARPDRARCRLRKYLPRCRARPRARLRRTSISTYQGCGRIERIARAGDMLQRRIRGRSRDQLEARHARRRRAPARAEQLQRGLRRGQADEARSRPSAAAETASARRR